MTDKQWLALMKRAINHKNKFESLMSIIENEYSYTDFLIL